MFTKALLLLLDTPCGFSRKKFCKKPSDRFADFPMQNYEVDIGGRWKKINENRFLHSSNMETFISNFEHLISVSRKNKHQLYLISDRTGWNWKHCLWQTMCQVEHWNGRVVHVRGLQNWVSSVWSCLLLWVPLSPTIFV